MAIFIINNNDDDDHLKLLSDYNHSICIFHLFFLKNF